jgi:hypothetical protein
MTSNNSSETEILEGAEVDMGSGNVVEVGGTYAELVFSE